MANLSRVLIIGGAGRIGSALNFGIKLTHSDIDVTNIDSVKSAFDRHSPSAVLSLASLDIRKCEERPIEAYKVNVLGIYNVVQEAAKRGIPVILISSGSIFNTLQPSTEKNHPDPQNIYAQTKYLAELFVLEQKKNLVIRTGWLFGQTPKGNIGFLEKMLQSTRLNEPVTVTTDHMGSPVYFPDFLVELRNLISSDASGIYHIANANTASAADFIHLAVSLLESKSPVKEVLLRDMPPGPKRSPCEALVSEKKQMRPWQEALQEYINSFV